MQKDSKTYRMFICLYVIYNFEFWSRMIHFWVFGGVRSQEEHEETIAIQLALSYITWHKACNSQLIEIYRSYSFVIHLTQEKQQQKKNSLNENCYSSHFS